MNHLLSSFTPTPASLTGAMKQCLSEGAAGTGPLLMWGAQLRQPLTHTPQRTAQDLASQPLTAPYLPHGWQ